MDVLTDDHEREQVVRKWWHENWKPIALGIVIALGGLIGFRQYQAYTLEKSQQQAYALYQMQYKLSVSPKDTQKDAEAYLKEHQDIYGALLALDLAAYESSKEQFEQALNHVDFAVKNGGKLVIPAASLSKARIQTQLKQYDDAVKTLDGVNSDAYAVEKAEIKGDVLLAKGDRNAARDAYREALKLCEDKKVQINPLLAMKLDDVAKAGDRPAFEEAREHNLSLQRAETDGSLAK
ncbi:MAG: tetratricopeptide repeat protein [Succinatimonas sp.]|nr:tetratricopeptide repeat protein [Succinatimonas sp.]